MPSLPQDRAKTLKEAFQLCDVGPLYGEALRFYQPLDEVRSMESINMVSTRLDFLAAGQFEALLFTGHRGCGKSTELRRLQDRWKEQYCVIYLEADEELDINDAEYTDLYLVLIRQVSEAMAALRLRFDAGLLAEFQQWFLEVTEETEEAVTKSVSLEATMGAGFEIPLIAKLATKLLSQIKGSNVQKKRIRETLQRDVGRLKEDLNRLLQDGFEKVKAQHPKGFLVIFDNLDRVPPEVGDRLYFDYATQLQEMACTLIYTVPISVVYSDKNLNNSFARPNIVPMVNLYEFAADQRDLKHNRDAVQALAKVIAQRMDVKALFTEKQSLLELVTASGGHIRQLMQMTATACLTAATRGHEQLLPEDVAYAVTQEQFNFERVIPAHHYPLLVKVCDLKRVEQDGDGQKMLFNTSVLEYDKPKRWNYVNPVVKNCDAFKQAVEDAESQSNSESGTE